MSDQVAPDEFNGWLLSRYDAVNRAYQLELILTSLMETTLRNLTKDEIVQQFGMLGWHNYRNAEDAVTEKQ